LSKAAKCGPHIELQLRQMHVPRYAEKRKSVEQSRDIHQALV
jgi:hypothetical protein